MEPPSLKLYPGKAHYAPSTSVCVDHSDEIQQTEELALNEGRKNLQYSPIGQGKLVEPHSRTLRKVETYDIHNSFVECHRRKAS